MAQKKRGDPPALIAMRWAFKLLTPVFPNWMGQYAYHLWFTPPKFKPPEREQKYIDTATARFIIVDGQKVRVWSWGKATDPTVLFIHGWGGRGTQISCFIDSLIQAGFNVMSFDMPAHGQSEGNKTNVFDISKVLLTLLTEVDNLHAVVTHSFGGVVFAHAYQSQIKVNKVTMICPPATLNTAFNQFSATLQLPQSVQKYIMDKLQENFGQDIFEQISLIKNAQTITQPVLVVHDTQDDVVPVQDGEEVAKALPNSTLYTPHELGHVKVLYDENVINRVTQFLNK